MASFRGPTARSTRLAPLCRGLRIVAAAAPACPDTAISRRRAGVALMGLAGLFAAGCPQQAGAADAAPKFSKTASGSKYETVVEGSGPAAQEGDLVLIDFVLRRSNGYFIYATQEGVSFQPKDVPVGPVALRLGDPGVVPGLQELLQGMRQGGRVRALMPPDVGYAAAGDCGALEPKMPTYATSRQLLNHCKEPLLWELQLLRINRP